MMLRAARRARTLTACVPTSLKCLAISTSLLLGPTTCVAPAMFYSIQPRYDDDYPPTVSALVASNDNQRSYCHIHSATAGALPSTGAVRGSWSACSDC